MSIEKNIVVDKIEAVSNGCIQVRTKTVITENGKQIAASFHRHVVAPGADYSKEDAQVQAICAAVHTDEVINAYNAALTAQGV